MCTNLNLTMDIQNKGFEQMEETDLKQTLRLVNTFNSRYTAFAT